MGAAPVADPLPPDAIRWLEQALDCLGQLPHRGAADVVLLLVADAVAEQRVVFRAGGHQHSPRGCRSPAIRWRLA